MFSMFAWLIIHLFWKCEIIVFDEDFTAKSQHIHDHHGVWSIWESFPMALYFKPAKKIEFIESRSQIKPLDQIQLDIFIFLSYSIHWLHPQVLIHQAVEWLNPPVT